MHRFVGGDLHVVGECVTGARGHESVLVYLLKNRGRPILIDTGSHLHRRRIIEEIDEVLGGTDPEVVFLTHTELPHTGNVRAVMEKWPEILPVAPSLISAYVELAPVVELEKLVLAPVGRSASFAGRNLDFVHGVLKDQPGTQWIYDQETRSLFTADAFGYFHKEGECALLSGERTGGISTEALYDYHVSQFRFLKWVYPERLSASLEKVFARKVEVIAPAHGNPITSDIPGHRAKLRQVLEQVRSQSFFEPSGEAG